MTSPTTMPTNDPAVPDAAPLTVSVVVPCHNYGRFLSEALDAIDAQTRRVDEIIVCDDASTDDSWSVIEAQAAQRPHVRVLRNETNLGAIATFNRLVQASSGDVVLVCSADDRYGPRYIEGTVGAIEEHGWGFAYTGHRLFGAEEAWFDAPQYDETILLRNNYIAGTSAFRREVYDAVGGFDPAFERCGMEDWAFWMAAITKGYRGGKATVGEFHWRRHEAGSRNTLSVKQRIVLRWTLLRRNPRFFFHPRTAAYLGRLLRGGATDVG